MKQLTNESEIEELSENICLFLNRLKTILKYICYVEKMDIADKIIIMNFMSEIVHNINIEIENLKYII